MCVIIIKPCHSTFLSFFFFFLSPLSLHTHAITTKMNEEEIPETVPMTTQEIAFLDAVKTASDENIVLMKTILRENPDFNLKDRFGERNFKKYGYLHAAVYNGNLEAARFLLTLSGIDPNAKNERMQTALHTSCMVISASDTVKRAMIELLLSNKRVDAGIVDKKGLTAFMYAVKTMKLEFVMQFVHHKNFYDLNPFTKGDHEFKNWSRHPSLVNMSALECAWFSSCKNDDKTSNSMLVLIKQLYERPISIRHYCRMKIRFNASVIADTFSLVVFFCDGFVKTTKIVNETTFREMKIMRFFTIASRLPIELQMLLCNRTHDSVKDTVLTEVSEGALQSLAHEFKKGDN